MGSFRHADAVAMRDSHWPFRACGRANIDVWCIGKDATGRPMLARFPAPLRRDEERNERHIRRHGLHVELQSDVGSVRGAFVC